MSKPSLTEDLAIVEGYFSYGIGIDEHTMAPIIEFQHLSLPMVKYRFKINMIDMADRTGTYLDMLSKMRSVIREIQLNKILKNK